MRRSGLRCYHTTMKLFAATFATLFKRASHEHIRPSQRISSLSFREMTNQAPVAGLPRERLFLRTMIIAGLILLVIFIRLFFNERNIGFYGLYVLLCISLGYKLIKILFEWYHY